jgi:hypothetical protein
MLEDSVVYSSGFLGPSTVTGIGQVGFTKDGGVGFRGHVRESGAIGHDYTLDMAFPDIKDSLGKVLVFTMQGEVHGLDAGSRSSDWERGGAKYDRIRTLIIDNWARLSTGTRCESTLHVSTSVVSVLNIVRDFLLVIIPGVETGANLVEFIESGNCTWGVGITGGPEDHPGVGGGARFRCEK